MKRTIEKVLFFAHGELNIMNVSRAASVAAASLAATLERENFIYESVEVSQESGGITGVEIKVSVTGNKMTELKHE